MHRHTQTAADLDNQRPIDESYIERLLGIALAFFLGTGIAAASVYWWSN